MAAKPKNVTELLSVEEIGPDTYQSVHLPMKLGNTAPIAYGGYLVGVCLSAVSHTVADDCSLYSCSGNFLAAASAELPVFCTVEKVRQTKAFSTRMVRLYQQIKPDQKRLCLILTADYHVPETAIKQYGYKPRKKYSGIEKSLHVPDIIELLKTAGQATDRDAEMYYKFFGNAHTYLESRYCAESIGAHNLFGVLKTLALEQDALPLTERTSAEWIRVPPNKAISKRQAEQAPALGFIMDGALSFLPLVHDHQFLDDAGACSTLEFALRILVPEYDINEWHLRERRTLAAEAGLTYTEATTWDQSGMPIVHMTQQCILRPKPTPKSKM